MSQTSVAEQAAKRAGDKADSGFDDVISRVAEGAVRFGRLCVLGTDEDRQCQEPSATGQVSDPESVLGFAIRSHAIESDSAVTDPEYKDKQMVSIMRHGRVYLKSTSAFAPTDSVFVSHTGANAGLVRNDNDGGNATLLAGARFRDTGVADDVATVEIDL